MRRHPKRYHSKPYLPGFSSLDITVAPVIETANVTNVALGLIGGNGVQNFTQATAINF